MSRRLLGCLLLCAVRQCTLRVALQPTQLVLALIRGLVVRVDIVLGLGAGRVADLGTGLLLRLGRLTALVRGRHGEGGTWERALAEPGWNVRVVLYRTMKIIVCTRHCRLVMFAGMIPIA